MFNQNHKIQIISKYNLYKTTNEFILSYVDLNRGGASYTDWPPHSQQFPAVETLFSPSPAGTRN